MDQPVVAKLRQALNTPSLAQQGRGLGVFHVLIHRVLISSGPGAWTAVSIMTTLFVPRPQAALRYREGCTVAGNREASDPDEAGSGHASDRMGGQPMRFAASVLNTPTKLASSAERVMF